MELTTPARPTQKERILFMLRSAGSRGVRSDAFYAAGIGRGVARIKDLRDGGYAISGEREGKYTRYRLLVGVGAGCPRQHGAGGSQTASPDSGESTGPSTEHAGEPPPPGPSASSHCAGPGARRVGGRVAPRSDTAGVKATSGPVARLFEPEPERPLSAFRDAEAA